MKDDRRKVKIIAPVVAVLAGFFGAMGGTVWEWLKEKVFKKEDSKNV